MFVKLAEKIKKLALRKYASVTFSLGWDHKLKTDPELEKHKSDHHKEIEKKLKDHNSEWKKRWEEFKYIGPEERKYEMFEKTNPDLAGPEGRRKTEDLSDELYEHESSEEFRNKKQEHQPEMNLANGNAAALLKTLGFTNEPAGTLNVNDVLQRILKYKNSSAVRDKAALREPMDEQKPGQARFIDHGLSADQMDNYMKRLEDLAQKALKYGVTDIHFG